jgi:putative DNA primase/helicase
MPGGAAAAALAYCRRGWPVFPCRRDNKRPLVCGGFHAATTDEVPVTQWWERWPRALIGVPTGRDGAGFVVLDIDVKRPDENGFDTLAELGHAILAETPMVHTASGGLHVYFDPGERAIQSTVGQRGRGIGRGLDIRGIGGYVIVPAPASGYCWDPFANFDRLPLAPAPDWLAASEPGHRLADRRPIRPSHGLSPYAEAALDRACGRILNARAGEQETTLNNQCFAIGSLAGSGGIPAALARDILRWAALQIPSYDKKRPWRAGELATKVDRAFAAGIRRPRGTQHE